MQARLAETARFSGNFGLAIRCAEDDRYFLSLESSWTTRYVKGNNWTRGVGIIGAKGSVLVFKPFVFFACCDLIVVLSSCGLMH